MTTSGAVPTPRTLAFRWGPNGELRADPAPPAQDMLEVVVYDGDQRAIVWMGEVYDIVYRWAAWCALQVADEWDAPGLVISFLEAENPSDELTVDARRIAGDAAWKYRAIKRHAKMEGNDQSEQIARRQQGTASATWCVTMIRLGEERYRWTQHRTAVKSAHTDGAKELIPDIQEAQNRQLRRMLLERILDESDHGLIDNPEPGSQELICDLLLQGMTEPWAIPKG